MFVVRLVVVALWPEVAVFDEDLPCPAVLGFGATDLLVPEVLVPNVVVCVESL